jgi:hypothetical protein
MLLAIPQALRSRQDFTTFDECLRTEDNNQVVQWEAEVAAWMEDKSLPDPYRVPPSGECFMFYSLFLSNYGLTL